MTFEVKERSFGDTLGTAFNLVFKNLGFILKYIFLTLLFFIVYVGLIAGGLYLISGNSFSSFNALMNNQPNMTSMSSVMSLLPVLLLPIIIAAYVFVPIIFLQKFSRVYTGSDEALPLGETIKRAAPSFWPFLGSYILMMLGIYAGMLLLFVPGIIFGLAWSMTPSIVVLEKGKVIQSMSRSWALTKGKRGSIFGTFFVMGLILYAIIFGVILLTFAITALAGQGGAIISTIFIFILEIVALGIFYPVMLALGMVIYYNLIVKKEGYGIQKLEEEFNKPQVDPEA